MNIVLLFLIFLCSIYSFAQTKVFIQYTNHKVIHFQGITCTGERLLGIISKLNTTPTIAKKIVQQLSEACGNCIIQ